MVTNIADSRVISILMMVAETVSETLDYISTVTRQIARDFIALHFI
jgi:hypothetical protein